MKEYTNNFYGSKTQADDETWTVDLYEGDEIKITTSQIPNEDLANAIIIPWVVQEGGNQEDRDNETDPVDPSDLLFERDFLK